MHYALNIKKNWKRSTPESLNPTLTLKYVNGQAGWVNAKKKLSGSLSSDERVFISIGMEDKSFSLSE